MRKNRKAEVYQHGKLAGTLQELDQNRYRFSYTGGYRGQPVSLASPVREAPYEFDTFPSVFDGLLPEGLLLDAFLRQCKIDKKDLFKQLITVGQGVGSLTIKEVL